MVVTRSRTRARQNGLWARAVEEAVSELKAFREDLRRKRRALKGKTATEIKAELVAEMCRYWEAWRATRGDFTVAIFAWSRWEGIEFRGDHLGALRAFVRLALKKDPKRASEYAKMMAWVLDTTVPGQMADQIKTEGPWLLARRLYTSDQLPFGPKVVRRKRALGEAPILINKGGEAFIERARRDAGSPCLAAVYYDDLRRLLQKEASEVPLTGVELQHLKKSLAAWGRIRCDDHICASDKCEYRKHEDWLEELDVETLYELLEARLS